MLIIYLNILRILVQYTIVYFFRQSGQYQYLPLGFLLSSTQVKMKPLVLTLCIVTANHLTTIFSLLTITVHLMGFTVIHNWILNSSGQKLWQDALYVKGIESWYNVLQKVFVPEHSHSHPSITSPYNKITVVDITKGHLLLYLVIVCMLCLQLQPLWCAN